MKNISFFSLVSLCFLTSNAQTTNYTINTFITTSATCTSQCLDKSSNVYCQRASNLQSGVCCSNTDSACLKDLSNGLCSSAVYSTLQTQLCPFSPTMCNSATSLISPPSTGTPLQIQYGTGFSFNSVCHYQISAPSTTKTGDLFWITLTSLNNIDTKIAIGDKQTSQSLVVCSAIQGGDTIAAIAPNKIFLTFRSMSVDKSQYSFAVQYGSIPIKTIFNNKDRCTDLGQNLIQSSQIQPPQQPNTFKVLTTTERQSLQASATANDVKENYYKLARSSTPFNPLYIILLTISGFFACIACCLCTNVCCQRNYKRKRTEAQIELEYLQIQLRNQQNRAARSPGQQMVESESSEDQNADVAQRQYNRVARINQMLASRNAAVASTENERAVVAQPQQRQSNGTQPGSQRSNSRRIPLIQPPPANDVEQTDYLDGSTNTSALNTSSIGFVRSSANPRSGNALNAMTSIQILQRRDQMQRTQPNITQNNSSRGQNSLQRENQHQRNGTQSSQRQANQQPLNNLAPRGNQAAETLEDI